MASPVWRVRAAIVYALGAVAGALLTATGLVVAGGLARGVHDDRAWLMGGLFAVATVAALADRVVPSLALLPENRRQVTQRVVRMRPLHGALKFGFEMGTGVRTYVTAASPYVVAAWVLLYGDLALAAATATAFGLGRSATNFVALAVPGDRRQGARTVAAVADAVTILIAAAAVRL